MKKRLFKALGAIMTIYRAYVIAIVLAVALAGCAQTGPKNEDNNPSIQSSIQELKEFMETHPSKEQLMTRIDSMKLDQPFAWFQSSPYTYSCWKLPSEGSITVFGWGNVTTRAELKDAKGRVVASVLYKTQEEAEAELQRYLKSRKQK